jgi:cysteine desulfurase
MLPRVAKSKKLVYLDYAATTPLDPKVKKAMEPFWVEKFANPSSLYEAGREAARAVSKARQTIAGILGVRPNEIIFTGGGSESVNLAIQGVARAHELAAKKTGHLVTSKIEHHSVLHSVQALQQEGWTASYIPVTKQGEIKLDALRKSIQPDTLLISIMYANNEIGTIEPIAEIGKWLKALNIERRKQHLPRILFHTDACQAAGFLKLRSDKLGVDLLSANGSKIYGPKQTGFLYKKSGVNLRPLVFGGGQEFNLRSGTENVAGIVGLAAAFELAQKGRNQENRRLTALRNYFMKQLKKKIPGLKINGPPDMPTLNRLPNNINVSIPGIEGEALLLYLDAYNIAVSTGSACATTSTDPSHVLEAIGLKEEYLGGSVRFTLGKATTKKNLDYVLAIMPDIVKELKRW